MTKTRIFNQQRRKRRTRGKLSSASRVFRLSVFRSNRKFYGQIIDDRKGTTLVAVSEKELNKEQMGKSPQEKAKLLGELLAGKAVKHKITQVKYDRGAYKYHGQVKAFAEGARSKGLDF